MGAHPFHIGLDFKQRIITTTVSGFWSLDTAKAFVMQYSIADVQMRKGGETFDTIVNIGSSPPLPRDASEFLEEQQGKGRPPQVRKMAYVCESILGRMQLRRITMGDKNMAVFAKLDEAHSWLAQP